MTTTQSTEDELRHLSASIWQWMSDQDVDSLRRHFHRDAVFVHMGATMDTQHELDTIAQGGIRYARADVSDVVVPHADEATGVVLSTMVLDAVVGGHEVSNPFYVTQTFVKVDGTWQLLTFAFTRRLVPDEAPRDR